MGMMFVYPFLSLLLTSRLGYSEMEASYIVVIASIASTLGTLVGGKLSDEIGRKKGLRRRYLCRYHLNDGGRFFASTHLVILFYHRHLFGGQFHFAYSVRHDSGLGR